MAFDVRVGLFDDPPSKETKKVLKMIKAVFDGFALLGKLNSGWEGLLYRFIKTPSYKKFVETQDITFSTSQEIIDRKVMELNKMAEEGEQFPENQGYLYEHKYETFQIQSFFKCGCPVNLSFYFELYKKCCTLLKHRSSLACAGVCYSEARKTTLLCELTLSKRL